MSDKKNPKSKPISGAIPAKAVPESAARKARQPLRGRLRRTRTLPVENIAAKKLLESWLTKDVQEQTESWARLERALEENRPSDRTLFS